MTTQSRKRLGWRLNGLRRNLEKLAGRIDDEPNYPGSCVNDNQSRTQIAVDFFKPKTCPQIQRRDHLATNKHHSFDRSMSVRNRRNVFDHLDLLHKATRSEEHTSELQS